MVIELFTSALDNWFVWVTLKAAFCHQQAFACSRKCKNEIKFQPKTSLTSKRERQKKYSLGYCYFIATAVFPLLPPSAFTNI